MKNYPGQVGSLTYEISKLSISGEEMDMKYSLISNVSNRNPDFKDPNLSDNSPSPIKSDKKALNPEKARAESSMKKYEHLDLKILPLALDK